MSKNCNVIAIFPIYGQFGVIRKPDSGRIVCKIYILIKSNLLSYKNWKQLNRTFNENMILKMIHLYGFVIWTMCIWLAL